MYSKTPSTTLSMLLFATLAAALALAGCSKGSNGAAPAGPATPGVALTAPITSDDDYIAKSTLAIDHLTAIFKSSGSATGTDCDKLAAELTRFSGENEAFLKATRQYETDHPEAQNKLQVSAKTNMAKFEETAQPVATACKDNKAAGAAMSKLSEQ